LNDKTGKSYNYIIKKKWKTYYDPADLKKFGKIVEWSEDLGNSFFEYYGKVFQEAFCSRKIINCISSFMPMPYLMITLVTVLKEELLKKKWWRLYMSRLIKGGAAFSTVFKWWINIINYPCSFYAYNMIVKFSL
jgi:hypothetical protein